MCVSGGRKGSRTLTKNICKSPIAVEVQRTVQGADLPKHKRCCCREVMLWIAQAAADVVPEIRKCGVKTAGIETIGRDEKPLQSER